MTVKKHLVRLQVLVVTFIVMRRCIPESPERAASTGEEKAFVGEQEGGGEAQSSCVVENKHVRRSRKKEQVSPGTHALHSWYTRLALLCIIKV